MGSTPILSTINPYEEVKDRLQNSLAYALQFNSGVTLTATDIQEVLSQLAQLMRERDDSHALIAEFGDKVTDMFEQMERGNWEDDHGHNVKMNAAMCALAEPVQKAIALRAALAMGKDVQ